jgi:dTDP-4-amino-4,6-dideoxygalactose transaminase
MLSHLSVHPDVRHVYHLFVIRVAERTLIQSALKESGIETGIHYPLPLHLQPAYRHLGYTKGDFPVVEDSAQRILSLPMDAELTIEQVDFVCDTVKQCISSY